MPSIRKHKKRQLTWERYADKIRRIAQHHYDYPWGLSIKLTPGHFAPRREMRYRNKSYYQTKNWLDEMDRSSREWMEHRYANP